RSPRPARAGGPTATSGSSTGRPAAGRGAPAFHLRGCRSGPMGRIGPQRERFSPLTASGRFRFGQRTFASTHGNGQDAPKRTLISRQLNDPHYDVERLV